MTKLGEPMSKVVWLLYHRERGFEKLVTTRLFGAFSSEEAVLKHLEWRMKEGYGVGEGWFVNTITVDEPHQPTGYYTMDVVYEAGRFRLEIQTVATELRKERA